MRNLAIAALMLLVTGCGPSADEHKAARKAVADAKLAAAKKAFAVFAEEATKGVELLEKHGSADAIRAESAKLHELLERASDVYPNSEKAAALGDEGQAIVRFFDAALKVADAHAHRKDLSP
jgi:hypothetical protein